MATLAEICRAYLAAPGALSPIYEDIDGAAVRAAAGALGIDEVAVREALDTLMVVENDENIDFHELEIEMLEALEVCAEHDTRHQDGYEQVAAESQLEAVQVALAEKRSA